MNCRAAIFRTVVGVFSFLLIRFKGQQLCSRTLLIKVVAGDGGGGVGRTKRMGAFTRIVTSSFRVVITAVLIITTVVTG